MPGMEPFSWIESTDSRFGPGISRPFDNERTKQFTLKVTLKHVSPMKWITHAATADKAKQYALARWPDATVEVIN